MLKALIILIVAVGVFGSAAYWTYELFLRPAQELKEEKSLPPQPAPPDPTIPEFEKCVLLQKQLKTLEARTALERFLEEYPQSTKLEEAREMLGSINTSIFLSPVPSPEKVEYVVKSGDVLNRVASRLKTTPELIMRSNRLTNTILRIGQRLRVPSGEFSLIINKRSHKVIVFNRGKFFKQYAIVSLPARHATPEPKKKKGAPAVAPVQRTAAKVSEKIAWSANDERITFADKGYEGAAHWIVVNVGGNTLYSEPDALSDLKAHKPPSGIGLAPAHMEELAALLKKGDPVTIEQ